MTTNLRLIRAETRLRTAALTWHHLAEGPDQGRGQQAVEDLHAACAELSAALQDADPETQNSSSDEQSPEEQDEPDVRP